MYSEARGRNNSSGENPEGFLEEVAFELYSLDLREWEGTQQVTSNEEDGRLKIPWTNVNIIYDQ